MNWFRDLSIGIKINLLVIVAGLTVTIAILIIQLTSTNALLDEIGQFSIEQEIVVLERRLAEAQEDIETASTVIVNTPRLVEAILSDNESALRSLYLSTVPSFGIDDFDIFDADGVRLFTTHVDEGVETQEDELIAQALLGIQRTSIIAEEQEGSTVLKSVSLRPIRGDTGTIVGGVILSQYLSNEMLSQINFDREGIELDLIYENTIIAKNSDNEVSIQPDLLSQALSEEEAVRNSEIIYSQNGTPYTEAYLPLQGLDDRSPIGAMIVRINNSAVATFQNDLITSSGTLLGTVIIIVIIAFVVLVRLTITRRLNILKEATSALARGNYSKKADIQGRDEIGELANSFNKMTNDIQQRQVELTELNDSLEQRVAERTIELREARDDALASQRIANENSRLKSEFLSMMSHELRTPMNAIQGFTGIMLKRMAGVEYNDKAERYLNKVQSNSERLLGLINDFLDLSRIESGRLEIAHLPMSPTEMGQQWRENLSVLADNKKLEFTLDIDPNLPETLYGDEEAISKIAINLVGNAIKFTETGSVKLSLNKQDDQMKLEVTDTGVGIPPHARDFIFDEFRQVDQSSKRSHGGTGLGLSIVQKLVTAMGGTVTLQSEVGEGSTFTVLLPMHTQDTVEYGVA